MACLGDIRNIGFNITNGKSATVKLLHSIIFGVQSRLNRTKLNSFKGFQFEANSEEYQAKVDEVKNLLIIADLISVCNILGIDYTGSEEEITKRIISNLCHIEGIGIDDGNAEDEEEEEREEPREPDERAYEPAPSIRSDVVTEVRQITESFSLSFRDVEDSIKPFDGKDGYPIEKWLQDFDEISELTGWNELQKLIYAKKSLRGLAKLFIQSEVGIKTWSKLRTRLIEEFHQKTSSAEIHKQLATRRKKKEETYQEYMLVMREIGSRAHLETEAIIQYIIDGIPDEPEKKSILYGAEDFKALKEKLRIYATIKGKTTDSRSNNDYTRPIKREVEQKISTSDRGRTTAPICFNCGKKGHRSNECPSKQRGRKCFRCNQFGHIATECRGRNEDNAGVRQVNVMTPNTISIEIDGKKIQALIDTGAEVSLMREDVYQNIGSPTLNPKVLRLTGIGTNKIETNGSCTTFVKIDEDDYELTFHIVPANTMDVEAVIGNNILQMANIQISSDAIVIHKKIETEERLLMKVSIDNKDEVDLNHLDRETREIIAELITNYQPNKIENTEVEMKIILKDEQPIFQTPRRLPFQEREEVKTQIDKWLQEGIIRPSCSEFASPVVVVRKKDNSARVCIDYRKLNKNVIRDRFPLPSVEDQLDELQDATIFTTIDLRNGFFHVDVEEESRKYTAFITSEGHYKFLKVPFGLCNSPAVFIRYINQVFRELMRQKIVLPYFDDVIIPAKDICEAIERLELFLEQASRYGLEINWKKCQFLQRRVTFLGHVIEDKQIRPSDEKTLAVSRFPKPTTIKQIQSFLGLTGYFRKFIHNYAIIAKPLTDLLKANSTFKFEESQVKAFQELKNKLISKPVLHIFKRGCKMEVHTDASKYGFGAVLLQECPEDNKLHPIHYMSRKTTPAQQNYCSYQLEVLAIVEALAKFRIYLLGAEFKLITDCQAFQKTMSKKNLTPRVARWSMFLEEFQFVIEHRPGKRLPHVDALSRYPIYMVNIEGMIPRLKIAQNKDDHIKAIKTLLEEKPYRDYHLEHDLLYKYEDGKDLLVIPAGMQSEIIKAAHEVGHFGLKKTEEIVKRDYFIPKLKEKIAKAIANCIPCILSNRKEGKKEGFLHPLPKEDLPLQTFHIDHLGPLPSTSKKYNHILSVIDAFSKFVWMFPTKSTTAQETIECLKKITSVFGNPDKIISDRGTAYTSEAFKTHCEEEGIKHYLITTGVPRGNGQIERIHRIMIPVITKLSIEDPTKWFKYVPRVQKVLNSTFQRSIQTTPFELLIGVRMRTKEDVELQKYIEEELTANFQELREDLRKRSKEHLLKIQEENKRTYNLRRRKPTKYKDGDLVAIKRTQFGSGLKVHKKFFSPYEVTKVKPNERYDVTKIGIHDGPINTTTCAENMKPWIEDDDDDLGSETDQEQDGRM